jgi:hypothetical protein
MTWFKGLNRRRSQDSFLVELRGVAASLRSELLQRQQGVPGPGTIDELQAMLRELSEVEGRVMTDSLPPPEQRWLAGSRIVTDTWPNDSELGDRICKLANLYRKVH